MYAITAQVESTTGNYAGSVQVPTFYLDETVQGIVDAGHAERIAREILLAPVKHGTTGPVPRVHVSAVKV